MTKRKKHSYIQTKIYRSPVRILAIMLISVFFAEAILLTSAHLSGPVPVLGEAFFDASALVVLLSPFFYFFLFRPLQMHIAERKAVEELLRESGKRIRSLSSHILTAQETERRRISRELHDELGQALALIKLKVRFIEQNLHQDRELLREECESIFWYLNQVIENVRRLSLDMSPVALEKLGLTESIRLLVDDFARAHASVEVARDITNIDRLFAEDADVIIYRIIQEALTNVARHAQAAHVLVAVEKREDNVLLVVEDDGKGFNAAQLATGMVDKRGLGLAIMAERARMLDGFIDIQSQEGKGTRITVSIPAEKTP
jgi:signal transduction histidine kinase